MLNFKCPEKYLDTITDGGAFADAYFRSGWWRVKNTFEEMVGEKFPHSALKKMFYGPTELDFVRSGLDDVIRECYQTISKRWQSDKRIPDLRTAAMMISLKKIASSYESLGIQFSFLFLLLSVILFLN